MKLHRIWLPLLLVFISFESNANTNQEQEDLTPAIEHLRTLEYDAAKAQLRTCVDTHPSDLRAWNYLAIATLYDEMFNKHDHQKLTLFCLAVSPLLFAADYRFVKIDSPYVTPFSTDRSERKRRANRRRRKLYDYSKNT
jgi:hypothetical protein